MALAWLRQLQQRLSTFSPRTQRRTASVRFQVEPLEMRLLPSLFSLGGTLATGIKPLAVAIADVNRDGKPDLVVANSGSKSVSVLLGNGNGTFAAATNFTTGVKPRSLAVADVNGDGRLDLLAADYGSAKVSVLLGNGDGTFHSAVN
jgi:hypothetical protein